MATALDSWFAQDASRLMDQVYLVQRNKGRVSALMRKGELQEGVGYNYVTLVSQRPYDPRTYNWSAVQADSGQTNICVPNQDTISFPSNQLAYQAYQRLVRSDPICFEDARRGYLFKQQVANAQMGLVQLIVDAWEDQDKAQYFLNAGHKIVANAQQTDYVNSSNFGTALPTSRLTQGLLDNVYMQFIQDGAGVGQGAVGMVDGAPQFTLVCSMERKRDVIKADADVRQDFRFAQMGEDKDAELLKAWGSDYAYGGFLYVIDNRMPRWTFEGGQWVQQPYYISATASNGKPYAKLNPSYVSAPYEDVYLWNPLVVKRLMPRPMGSAGADTRFNPVNWNGQILWKNIPSETENPLSNIGRWYAPMMAAWEPAITQYGAVIRVQRCPSSALNPCVGY